MTRLLLATGLAALLALSAPVAAEPMSGEADHRPPDELKHRDASEGWFFGDGGFGCPLWWCGDAGLAPERSRQVDPGEGWFFGDGGFGCPLWWCGDAGLAPERPRQVDPGEGWFFGDGGFGCPLWRCGDRRGDQPAGGG